MAGGRADRVLVLSIPDWGVTPFAREPGRDTAQIARRTRRLQRGARAANARDAAWPSSTVTGVYRAHAAEPDMLAADGLHPAAAMHALWARMSVPVARRMLADD